MKRLILLVLVTIAVVCQVAIGSAAAIEIDRDTRTVQQNEAGEQMTLSVEQIQEGKRLFNFACAGCHIAGETKTDPNVDLSPKVLALATPPRDNIEALVDYLHHPTTYDGEVDIGEIHPSTEHGEFFPVMRNLTDENLVAIAGHILTQPKIIGQKWAGGKPKR